MKISFLFQKKQWLDDIQRDLSLYFMYNPYFNIYSTLQTSSPFSFFTQSFTKSFNKISKKETYITETFFKESHFIDQICLREAFLVH